MAVFEMKWSWSWNQISNNWYHYLNLNIVFGINVSKSMI